MKIYRNAPCPCGSGRKYKRCCAAEAVSPPIQTPSSSRYRFEAGSYGGAGRGYMPSALCYKQTTGDQCHEYFCLANTTLCYDDEIEATSKAESDLNEAFGIKASGGSEIDLAMTLKDKGYIKIDGFQRAID
ncbi:MAG: SEC-C domain-containing protein [Phycisphaerae bacterium]|nr:SEC-C domain-containing protein [Phycisphaerae bacterium]